tara:strand:- start:569 stop:904 length:336 start_codon:yes stop_codon:yes gene_type:complete
MNNILAITSNAAKQIKEILSNAPEGIDSILVGIDKSGCSGYSYKLDFAKASDFKNFENVDKDGVKVLIDPKATLFLLGSTMDYKTDKLSSRFVFDNPNEKGTCGCGESFNF